MRPRYVKLPDGRFAKPQVSRVEQYLRTHLPAGANATIPRATPEHPSLESPVELDVERLSGREILLCGAGSVGSYLAHFLSVASVILHVVDFKKVENKHLVAGRTTYTPRDLGLLKVETLKRRIEGDHPGTRVRPYPCNVAQFADSDLKALFQRCLIVVLAIDDPEQIIRVADLAYPLVVLLQAAMHARGHSSHIIISIPHVTPCLRCSLEISDPHDITRLDREPSASGDIVTLANMAANFALDLACSKVTGQRITRWDVSKNRIYLSNPRDETVNPDSPGLKLDRVQSRPECPICNHHVPS